MRRQKKGNVDLSVVLSIVLGLSFLGAAALQKKQSSDNTYLKKSQAVKVQARHTRHRA